MSQKRKEYPTVELTIESTGFEGISIARKDELVYFVKGVVPGDRIIAQITRKRKNHAEARLIEILEKSNERTEPLCTHFGTCGGCSWQMMKYSKQLQWKKQHVRDAFERLGKVPYESIYDPIEAPKEFHYRNKMEFSFGASRWLTDKEIAGGTEFIDKNFALGLHIPGRFDKILNINECHIQPMKANKLLREIRSKAIEMNLSPYHQREHTGFLRNLVFRFSEFSGELMMILITQTHQSEPENKFIDWLFGKFKNDNPEITSLLHVVNDTWSPVAIGTITRAEGNEFITESILDVKFKISPFSFFQTNSGQLNQFINKILETAQLTGVEYCWDFYCGTGSITLPASKLVRKITGFELVESSICDAKSNAEFNGILNAEFYSEDLHRKNIHEFFESFDIPDVVLIDPPRAGMHTNLIEVLIDLRIKKIVYVSCNPATQARDCALLSKFYNVISLQPVDMFPQTYHVENIALLELKPPIN